MQKDSQPQTPNLSTRTNHSNSLFPSLKLPPPTNIPELKAPVSPNHIRSISSNLPESNLGHQPISRPKNYLDESEIRSVLSNLGSGTNARKALESIEFQNELDALDPDGFESKYGAQFDSRKEVIKTAHLSVEKVVPVKSSWVYLYNLPFDFDRMELEKELREILGRFGPVEKSLLFRHSDFYTHEMHMEMDVFLEKGGERMFLYDYHNIRERKRKQKQKEQSQNSSKNKQSEEINTDQGIIKFGTDFSYFLRNILFN